jgi:hypothetical protein
MANTVQLSTGLDCIFKKYYEFYYCLALKVEAGKLSCIRLNKIILQQTEHEAHSNGREKKS